MTDDVSNDDVELVIKSLGNEKFRWRTVPGVAKETGLPEETVRIVITRSGEKLVRSPASSEEGLELFTTRDRFRQTASVGERLLGALKNRVI